ncbi:NAD(P)/FAD-dependent oxidoreductase [Roseiterribacter gracilis]|uniref:Putative ferredoxin reductase n=1 Tax=Roseiterribacter gracilis TaxID=2812848 RepID=A0A8S8XCZ9_9PROT|nr:putative ferredoxin reductase [Rhodospirillales bacterium TMPK1]
MSDLQFDVVVVGGGHAAGRLLAELIRGGFEGSVRVIGDEPDAFYERPPLSKSLLAGKCDLDSIAIVRGADLTARMQICSAGIVAVDRIARRVTLGDGTTVGYGKLVLATGASPRRLGLLGESAANVHRLRNTGDVARIRAGMGEHQRWVIVGGGYIGLEVAATLRQASLDVTLVERAPRLLGRAASAAVASHLAALHEVNGVTLRVGVEPKNFCSERDFATGLKLADGEIIPGTQFLVGAGALPNDALARAADIDCDDGILVEPNGATSDPSIFAIGDATRHRFHPATGGAMRFECWQNAEQQASALAAHLLGRAIIVDLLPWFWTEQYDQRVDTFGLVPADATQVRREGPTARDWTQFHLVDGRIVAAEIVNHPSERRQIRKLVVAGARLDPALLGDSNTDLRALAA